MGNLIITISREFGSGGRKIGELLATQLCIPFYDKEIIQMTAEKSGLSADFVAQQEEHSRRSFLFSIASSSTYGGMSIPYPYDSNVTDQAYFSQTDIIRELAAAGSCVIVGRCADYILREEEKLLRVFVTADPEKRRQRIVTEYGMDEKTSAEKLRKADKARAGYFRHYTGEEWGDVRNYDLIINSDFTGVTGAVEVIKAALRTREYIR